MVRFKDLRQIIIQCSSSSHDRCEEILNLPCFVAHDAVFSSSRNQFGGNLRGKNWAKNCVCLEKLHI